MASHKSSFSLESQQIFHLKFLFLIVLFCSSCSLSPFHPVHYPSTLLDSLSKHTDSLSPPPLSLLSTTYSRVIIMKEMSVLDGTLTSLKFDVQSPSDAPVCTCDHIPSLSLSPNIPFLSTFSSSHSLQKKSLEEKFRQKVKTSC